MKRLALNLFWIFNKFDVSTGLLGKIRFASHSSQIVFFDLHLHCKKATTQWSLNWAYIYILNWSVSTKKVDISIWIWYSLQGQSTTIIKQFKETNMALFISPASPACPVLSLMVSTSPVGDFHDVNKRCRVCLKCCRQDKNKRMCP